MSETAARRYRLHPPDDLGVLFGLTVAQVAVLALAMVAGVLAMAYGSATAGVAVLAVGAAAGLGRLNGQPLLASAPLAVRWLRRRVAGGQRWFAPIPLWTADDGRLSLPPVLSGQRLLAVDAAAGQGVAGPGQVGVVHDGRGDVWAATVRVSGRRFALLEPEEQDRLAQWWGTALSAFCAERTPVVSIRWSLWSAPSGMRQQETYLAEHLAAEPAAQAREAYEQLLAAAGPLSTTHEVLVTLSVAGGRVRASREQRGDRRRAAVETLLGELLLFSRRLEAAGLVVSAPLSPGELARAVRVRFDPACAAVLDGQGRSLGDRAGVVSWRNAGPLAAESAWTHWRVDGSVHRSFFVARWPLLEVPVDWLGQLLLHTRAVRTVTVGYEPVGRAASQRRVIREAAKLAGDADHRASKGFRVGARHRRAATAVGEREEELVAGFGELGYAGLVTVTAGDLEELRRGCEEAVQTAASCGVELRPLDGRHDQAAAAALPLARGLAPRITR
ncbi:MAG: hypothetical protein GEV12_19145 [Micromonosporaceae bacterium]|nr:hypothetical protein [Micromonosporaceae bacterium]